MATLLMLKEIPINNPKFAIFWPMGSENNFKIQSKHYKSS